MWDFLKKQYKNVDKGLANVITGNSWNDNRPSLSPNILTPLPLSTYKNIGPIKRREPEIPLPMEVKEKPKQVKKVPTPTIGTKIIQQPKKAEAKSGLNISYPTPTPTPDPRKSWRNFADMVIREGDKRGYSGETLARQKALESGFGKSDFAKNRYNYGGVGAYDANPDNAWRFDSPEDYLMGPKGYFNLIEKDPRYTKAYQNRGNPRKYLEALKEAGYASDDNYVEKILSTRVYDPNEYGY